MASRRSRRQLCRVAGVAVEALEGRRLLTAFVVNTLFDVPGLQEIGLRTLREAIGAANANPGADTISFDPSLTAGGAATIRLTSGALEITDTTGSTTITGPGARFLTVDAHGASSVFRTATGTTGSYAVLERLTITGGAGSGVVNTGYLAVVESSLEGNSGFQGGAISNTSGGYAIVTRSTLSGNSAEMGGGLFSTGRATFVDSTISGNTATQAAGIFGSDLLQIFDSTVSNNTAASFGGVWSLGTLEISNSIVAGNTAATNADVSGSVTGTNNLSTNNLIGNGTGLTGTANGILGNQVGTAVAPLNARLSALAFNGGQTRTHALQSGSPAIDAGVTNGLSATDQRGLGHPRVANGTADIGAFEYKLHTESLVVTTLTDEDDGTSDVTLGTGTSLREAIRYANSFGGADTIRFAADLTSGGPAQITLRLGTLFIADPTGTTTVDGPGAGLLTVMGNRADTVFHVTALAQIDGLTITGGKEGDRQFNLLAGGVYNDGTLAINRSVITGNEGRGVFNAATLTVRDSTISNNASSYAAGILNNGIATIIASTISGNTAMEGGGGIYNSGGGTANPSLTIINSTITGNAAGAGGGIYNSVSLIVSGSTIFGNSATITDGGGIYNADQEGTVKLSNTIVAGNIGRNGADVFGVVLIGARYNLIGNGSGMTGLTNGVLGNQVGTAAAPINAMLGALADNGGAMRTMAILAGSPAFNSGDPVLPRAARQ